MYPEIDEMLRNILLVSQKTFDEMSKRKIPKEVQDWVENNPIIFIPVRVSQIAKDGEYVFFDNEGNMRIYRE